MESDFKELEETLSGKALWNEPMRDHTSYGIGGPAMGLFYPADEKDLSSILVLSQKKSIPVFFAGSGSNLLVSDDGFNGFVISLTKTFKTLEINGGDVYAECGVMMGHFVKKCVGAELTGVESLIGVPGTLGGAIRMNAGAYGQEVSDVLISATVLERTGQVTKYPAQQLGLRYRQSSLARDAIVLEAVFRGEQEEIAVINSRIRKIKKARETRRSTFDFLEVNRWNYI